MAYLTLMVIPVLIAVSTVLSPTARQGITDVARNSISRTTKAIEQLRNSPELAEHINGVQRRIAAYLLHQAADSVERK